MVLVVYAYGTGTQYFSHRMVRLREAARNLTSPTTSRLIFIFGWSEFVEGVTFLSALHVWHMVNAFLVLSANSGEIDKVHTGFSM